jgi:hypothetical protein
MTALIAYQSTPDDPIRAIRLLNDSHILAAGRVLQAHYATPDRVEALIAMGDLVTLGAHLGDGVQRVTHPTPDTCVALHRDWGDALLVLLCADRESLLRTDDGYVYLYANGQWEIKVRWRDWSPVADVIALLDGVAGEVLG